MPAPVQPIKERFERQYIADPNSGCWLWTGELHYKGYGRLRVGRKRARDAVANGKSAFAHRLSYEMYIGPIPDGLVIDHKCRQRCCVNPWHLEPVTNQENCKRGNTGKHLSERTHCPKGHPYSGDNLYIYTRKSGSKNRMCRTCLRISNSRDTKYAGGYHQ